MELVALDEFKTEIVMMKVAILASYKVALLVSIYVCVCDSAIIIRTIFFKAINSMAINSIYSLRQ